MSGLAAILVIVAVGIGLRMVLHAIPIQCTSGPGGSHCYTHPRAGEGATLIITAVLLGIVIALAAMLIKLALVGDSKR